MSKNIPNPLLLTKLFPPTISQQFVNRPHLFDYLGACADCKLTLLTAPAGFGKSTLISAWLTRGKTRFAWISLDKNDNEPFLFLSYVIEALQQMKEGVGTSALSSIQSAETSPTNVILTYLLNDLASLKEPSTLVFDDYHNIDNDEIHRAVEFFIENAPDNIKFVISSRQIPKISLSKFRARNQILEMNASHLRFNLEEIESFFGRALTWRLSKNEISILERQTEGWVTGLQLAALGLKNNKNTKDFILKFRGGNKLVGDYLVDEVLTQLEDSLQRFLILTSILHRFSASLCNALLEIENSRQLLVHLEKENLFLVSLDDKDDWYRYHHLFGEMLNSRLVERFPEIIPDLYQRAINWHVVNGLVDEAIDYSLECQDYDRAADLLLTNIDQPQTGLEQKRMQNWLQQMPIDTIRKHSDLWVQYNLSQFYYSNYEKSIELFKHYENEISKSENKFDLIYGIEITLQGPIILHTTLDANKVLMLTQQALEILPVKSNLIRGIALGHHGSSSLLIGDLKSAQEYLMGAIKIIEDSRNLPVLYVFQNYLAETMAAQGHLHQAAEKLRIINRMAQISELHNAIHSGNLTSLGLIHYEWNQMDEAKKYIQSGQLFTESYKSIDRSLQAAYASLKISLFDGDISKIETYIDGIEEVASKYNFPLLVMDRIDSLRSIIALTLGKTQQATRWAHIYAQLHQDEVTCMRQHEWLAVIRVWMKTGNEVEAIKYLQQLHELSFNEGRIRDWISISAMLAAALDKLGNQAAALPVLEEAVIAAEHDGYIRSFLDEGESIKTLLQKILSETDQTLSRYTYIKQIIKAFPKDQYPLSSQILTPRELDVVKLLAEGLTYDQITDQLAISMNTLKFHIKNIYNKLEINNRTEAVLIAQKQGFI